MSMFSESSLFSVVPLLVFWLSICGGLVAAWYFRLGYMPHLHRVRTELLSVLAGVMVLELGLCCTGILDPFMAPALLLLNAWGPLDAVLRYPFVYELDSLFAVKQLLLLCAKLALFPFGFVDLLAYFYILVALWSLDFVVLPFVYIVSLPFECTPAEQRGLAKLSGASDTDVAVRLARAVASPGNRTACMRVLRKTRATLSSRKAASPLPVWSPGAGHRRRFAAYDVLSALF